MGNVTLILWIAGFILVGALLIAAGHFIRKLLGWLAFTGFHHLSKLVKRSRKATKLPDINGLEDRLAFLAGYGFRLQPDFGVKDLLESWDRDQFETPGDWDTVIIGLGMTEEQDPWRPHCRNLWHFDVEFIDGHGAYIEIARRVMELTGGTLKLANLEDCVDFENGQAWLSFDFNGSSIKWDLEFDNDWTDMSVFDRFAGLLSKVSEDTVLVFYELDGQDCIIGCTTLENLNKLKEHGFRFERIEPM